MKQIQALVLSMFIVICASVAFAYHQAQVPKRSQSVLLNNVHLEWSVDSTYDVKAFLDTIPAKLLVDYGGTVIATDGYVIVNAPPKKISGNKKLLQPVPPDIVVGYYVYPKGSLVLQAFY